MMSHPDALSRNTHGTLRFLDGLRGLTALYVLLFHARWLLWEGFFNGYLNHPQLYALPARLIAYGSLAFYYGHQAVLLFFILSGFVIHLRYAQQAHGDPQSRFDLIPFLWRRFKRIYPPLLWALTLTYVLDSSILASPSVQHLLAQMGQAVSYSSFGARLSGTLFLIPMAPEWGSNIPFWSLRLEWWFYLLYPALWWINRRSLVGATGLIAGLCALSFVPGFFALEAAQDIFSLLIVWWLGTLLAEVYVGRIRIKFGWLAPLALALGPLLFSVEPFLVMSNTLRDVLWGIAFVGLFSALFAWQNRGGSLRWLERLKPLGDMSYTLYVTHLPIITFISAWLIAQSPNGSLPMGYQWIVIGVLVCLGSAYLTHLVVERPFQRRSVIVKERPVLEQSMPTPS